MKLDLSVLRAGKSHVSQKISLFPSCRKTVSERQSTSELSVQRF